MTDTTTQPQLRKFFGDGEHTFTLTAPLILELERATGAGIGKLCSRLFDRAFDHKDVTETIRLALIGGGLDPKRAKELVQTYVTARPLIFSYEIAVAVLEHVWFGPAENTEANDAAA